MSLIAPARAVSPPAYASARHRPVTQTVALPVEARRLLRSIASDLRNMPRDCIGDRAELIHWLNRTARRVESVERLQLPTAPSARNPVPAPQIAPPRPISAYEAAEAVFSGQGQPRAKRTARRTITSRKGRTVQVETRQLTLCFEAVR